MKYNVLGSHPSTHLNYKDSFGVLKIKNKNKKPHFSGWRLFFFGRLHLFDFEISTHINIYI